MTISVTDLNIEPIIPYIFNAGYIILAGIALFLLHNLGGLKIFSKHDNNMVKQFLEKYPLVSTEFMNKSAKARDIENNQEIHELNKRIEHLEQYVYELNDKINQKLENILKELHRG